MKTAFSFFALALFSINSQAADQFKFSECYYVALSAFNAHARELMDQQNGSMAVDKVGLTEVAEGENPSIVTYVIKVDEVDDDGFRSKYDFIVETARTVYHGRYPSCQVTSTRTQK